jgi:2-oxoglutarate dehydrogenase complex dehydrogenase (E1) component-like enzyme
MSLTIEELIEIVGERYDPDLLVEVMQITSEEILERFKDKVEENYDKFEETEDNNNDISGENHMGEA